MKIFGKTDIGQRRDNNQDTFRFGECGKESVWAVVCDGMGGVSGGQVASRIAAETMERGIQKGYHEGIRFQSVKELLRSAMISANLEVFEAARDDTALRGMGTTVVAVVIADGYAIIAHVGDSRAYLIRDGEIRRLTKDHSIVQYMIDSGRITPKEALTHPDRNIITRAVGVDAVVETEIDMEEIRAGDKLLLCTDGLTNCLDDSAICGIIQEEQTKDASERLVEAANANGGSDNITALVIEC